MTGLQLSLLCKEVIRKSALPALTDPPPFVLEIKNHGPAEASVEEIGGFNLDVPGSVLNISIANASFVLVQLGRPKGAQRYTCIDASRDGKMRQLKVGDTYRVPVDFSELQSLEPGEYEAWLEYHPRSLKSERRRFRVVP